ncbi:MAG: TolC family protein [Planctomycetota bacterium]
MTLDPVEERPPRRSVAEVATRSFPPLEMVFVQLQIPRAALALAIAGALPLCGGCRSYEPRPLDLDAHRAAWRQRTPADEPVRVFAERLVEAGDPSATAFAPEDGLSPAEGELVALVYNPDLRLARLRAGVARATAEHAGLWDDPELEIDVLRITESVSDRWIVTPGLAFTIPLSGRVEAEQARADAALRAELERVAEAEWRVRHDVRRAWLAWSAATLRAEQTERLVASMDSLVDSTARLAEAGEMPRTEAALFAIEQTQRRHELRRLRGEVAEAEQRLRALLGLAPEAPVTFVAALEAGRPAAALDADALAARNPTLARLRREYEVAEQTLHREIRKQYPDLTIGPLYESDQGQSRIGFLGGLPLPILNANRQGIAEAEAARALARAAFETEYERRAGALAAARVRAEALRAQREELATVLAPLVDRQLADARRLLELGEGGGLVLLESLVRAHRTRLELVAVRLDEARAAAEMTYLVGPAIPAPTPDPPETPASPDAGPEVTP